MLIDVCFSISVFIVITNNIDQYQDIITFYLGELNIIKKKVDDNCLCYVGAHVNVNVSNPFSKDEETSASAVVGWAKTTDPNHG